MSESGDTRVTDSGGVTVPAAVREALGIQPGDFDEFDGVTRLNTAVNPFEP